MSAKFADSDKKKANGNPLMKYFANKPDQSTDQNQDQITNTEQLSVSIENAKSNSSKNSSEVLSEEVLKFSANALVALDQATTSKKADESDLDADNFDFIEDSNDVIVDPETTNSLNVNGGDRIADESDDVDYIRCEKCRKRISVWEFPEHEDFHFAQELSKQICMPAVTSSVLNASKEVNSNRKRSISDTPNKSESSDNSNSKKPVMKASKKLKTDPGVNSKQTNIKSIDNYFKKK